ncbi:MAG: hypothetical protein IPK61_13570 [Saprospiraceae bacterium]|nr:hypothetical protein [Saprospiraceae bacterium]
MLSLFLVLTTGLTLSAQSTVTGKITHDGLQRTYRFYIPQNLKAGQKLPLVFNLHGLGSNGIQQEFYGDFRKIADTAGFSSFIRMAPSILHWDRITGMSGLNLQALMIWASWRHFWIH